MSFISNAADCHHYETDFLTMNTDIKPEVLKSQNDFSKQTNSVNLYFFKRWFYFQIETHYHIQHPPFFPAHVILLNDQNHPGQMNY